MTTKANVTITGPDADGLLWIRADAGGLSGAVSLRADSLAARAFLAARAAPPPDLAEIESLVGAYGARCRIVGKAGAQVQCDALLSAIAALASPASSPAPSAWRVPFGSDLHREAQRLIDHPAAGKLAKMVCDMLVAEPAPSARPGDEGSAPAASTPPTKENDRGE